MTELWQGEALRDYALRTGEFDRAIAFIKLKFYLGDAPAQHLDVCNDVDAVYLSELLAASGQPQQAVALRRAAASWYDANEAKYLGSRRLRARVLLLLPGGIPSKAIPCGCRCTMTRGSGPSKRTCGGTSMRSAANLKRCGATALFRDVA